MCLFLPGKRPLCGQDYHSPAAMCTNNSGCSSTYDSLNMWSCCTSLNYGGLHLSKLDCAEHGIAKMIKNALLLGCSACFSFWTSLDAKTHFESGPPPPACTWHCQLIAQAVFGNVCACTLHLTSQDKGPWCCGTIGEHHLKLIKSYGPFKS